MNFGRPLALLCGALCGMGVYGAAATAQAAPCYSSTANSVTYADPLGDGDAGLAPDIVSGSLVNDGACGFTMTYSLSGQSSMISGDFLSWFIDTDSNLATGSQTGFRGADFAVGRLDTGSSALARYNPATASFDTVKALSPSGAFGVRANLADFESATTTTFAVAGGAHWQSVSTGYSYYDFAPNVGMGTIPFGVQFTSSAPPSPVPAPAPAPAPVAPPAPAPAAAPAKTTGPASTATCRVPVLRGLRPAQARSRLRAAGCKLGRVRYKKASKLIGRVVGTSPKAGESLAHGASVDVTVARRRRASARKAHAATAGSTLARVTMLVNRAAQAR